MADYLEELTQQIRDLSRAVTELQQRMAALESRVLPAHIELAAPEPEDTGIPTAQAVLMSFAPGTPSVAARTDNLAGLFGWALLGLAGAYLLRALTESGAIPGLAGAIVGILYAAWWLFLAARRAGEKPLFGTVHGLTAALILSPMLWEVTVRFHLLSAGVASAVLVLFAVWGLAIGWRRNITAIAWIGTLAGLLTVSALFRESHDATVWVVSSLLIAAAIEFSACRDHWLSLRWVVAILADVVVLVLTYVVARGGAGFVMGAQLALLAIYAASTIDRTVVRRLPIAWFEVSQLVVAFAIAISGALHLNMGLLAGLVCLAGGAACYAAAFGLFRGGRNFFTYSTFGILLTAAAGWLLIPGAPLAGAAALLAVAAMWLGASGADFSPRGLKPALQIPRTLRIHGFAYLVLATVAGYVLPLAAGRVVRTGAPVDAGVPLAYVLAIAGALACYVVVWRLEKQPVESVLPAALFCLGLTGLVAGWLSAAPLRTALLTALAVGCGWCGRRWNRTELVWLIWPLLAVAGIKVIMEDIHRGSVTLFLSFLCGAVALILLPRLLRQRTGVVVDDAPAVRAAAQH